MDSIQTAASNTSAAEARDKLIGDLKNVITEAEDWLTTAKSSAGGQLDELKDQFTSTLETAKSDLLKLEGSLVAKSKLAAKATDEYVQEHPWTSVGVGAVIGVLAGLLLARS